MHRTFCVYIRQLVNYHIPIGTPTVSFFFVEITFLRFIADDIFGEFH